MNYVEYDENNLQSFEITTKAISNGSLIGSCELGTAEIQLINDSNEYSDFKNKWIHTSLGSLYIHSVEPVQEKINIKLSCYDIKHVLDVEYKKEDFISLFPCSIVEWRNAIANKLNISFNDNNEFPNSDYILPIHPFIQEKSSCRDVLSIIAGAGGSWVEIDELDNFYFSWVKDTEPIEIDDWLDLTTEKTETKAVDCLVLGRGDVEDIVTYPDPAPTNAKELRIDNNYILDPQDTTTNEDRRYDVVQPIYNQIVGFSYIPFSMRTQSVSNPFNIKLGSKIKYIDIWQNELTSIVMTKTLNWLGGDLSNPENWELSISAEDIKDTSSDYKLAKPSESIKDISFKVDKQNEKIQGIVKTTDEHSEKLTSFEETIEGILLKVETNIDIDSEQETLKAELSFKNILNGVPIFLQIHPVNEEIGYNYPTPYKTPGSKLMPKSHSILRFHNIIENEDTDYIIPTQLRVLGNVYDELYIDYINKKAYVTKRISVNEEGQLYVRENEKIEDIAIPSINLKDGDYKVSLLGYEKAYLKIALTTKNKYTELFPTLTYMGSVIEQLNNSILLEVKEEYIDKGITGASIIMKINNEESEIGINADKLKLEGYTTINKGFGVDLDGNAFMNNAQINGGNIEMLDDGDDKEHSIKLYKKSDIEEISRTPKIGEDLGGKTLSLNFPNNFIGSFTGVSIAFENLIECENGTINYVFGYQYSDVIRIYYKFNDEYKDLYLDYYDSIENTHNIETNLKNITLPDGFGKVVSINNSIKDMTNNKSLTDYINIKEKNIKYSTEFNSNGISIKKDKIRAYYQGNGMSIVDERGTRHFDEYGIRWTTPHGYDYIDFIVNQDGVTFGNYFLVKGKDIEKLEIMQSSDGNEYLEIKTITTTYGVNIWASDKRLKKNIKDSKIKALDIIKKIKHHEFKYKVGNGNTVKIGYIADELQKIDEQMIFEVGEDKIKQPNQSYIIPLLSKALQEQQVIIENQNKKIISLEERISKLEKLIIGVDN